MPDMSQLMQTDFLVIGSGIAGLSFALRAAEHGEVLIITKRSPEDGNTAWAQGGIAAVLDPLDSLSAHVTDTLTVGDGLCHRDIVELVVSEGPAAVRELGDRWGVLFDRASSGELDLAREGGHSACCPRVQVPWSWSTEYNVVHPSLDSTRSARRSKLWKHNYWY